MAFCEQCGKELSVGAKFCTECGAAVEMKSDVDMEGAQARVAAEVINELSAEAAGKIEEEETAKENAAGETVKSAEDIKENMQYRPVQNSAANNQNQYQNQYQQGYDPRKSRTLAGIFGILFGYFGVHNFYLGYTSKAVIQLCVSIVGLLLSCLGIGIFIVAGIAIWGLVEGIMILAGSINADAKGVPLRD